MEKTAAPTDISSSPENEKDPAPEYRPEAEIHVVSVESQPPSLEEYMHYASITQAELKALDPEPTVMPWSQAKKREAHTPGLNLTALSTLAETGAPRHANEAAVTSAEWQMANRSARTATWFAVFYLITTDILGPFSTPWAFAQLGYVPGAFLYTVFGAFAAYGGYMLYLMFLVLDSDKFPVKTYSDLALRLYGEWFAAVCNVLQAIQLFMLVGIIIIQNGQSLSQMSQGKVCFIVLCFIWAVGGALVGQIRTLRNVSWLSSISIYMNVFVLIMTMALAGRSGPDYATALANNGVEKGPIITTIGVPAGSTFSTQVVGLMQAVYSYGGSMLFIEFMAEMRRPWDFWKAMMASQVFIFCVYLFFGMLVYSFQGQFAINPAYQGVASHAWQTVANSIMLAQGLIAACLYGNIGIKVLYNSILRRFLGFPELETKKGKIFWVGVVPIYWALAFVLAAAIPQVSNLSALLASVCIAQFTYVFPPFLMLGYSCQAGAIECRKQGGVAAPPTGIQNKAKDLFAGYMKRWVFNSFNLMMFLCAIVASVLGIYSSVLSLKTAYAGNSKPSFSCVSPVG
ncbi:hypothetical protein BP6252_04218 [Coleophoma cylindrospora]|uniref:Amino acid transporter transmembrane domain-containing protein n=1 Tax=Coleophoma cylindrospora TaxID=1849047 RepID=A0A3D8S0D6_9HELO|nr:hypothetical protein BP6252_04218 [Coleophoma cylindrospora]